jgi:hypothetical protein
MSEQFSHPFKITDQIIVHVFLHIPFHALIAKDSGQAL